MYINDFVDSLILLCMFILVCIILPINMYKQEQREYCVPQNEQQVRHYGTDHNGQLVCWVTESGSSTGVIKVVEYQVIGKELKQ